MALTKYKIVILVFTYFYMDRHFTQKAYCMCWNMKMALTKCKIGIFTYWLRRKRDVLKGVRFHEQKYLNFRYWFAREIGTQFKSTKISWQYPYKQCWIEQNWLDIAYIYTEFDTVFENTGSNQKRHSSATRQNQIKFIFFKSFIFSCYFLYSYSKNGIFWTLLTFIKPYLFQIGVFFI